MHEYEFGSFEGHRVSDGAIGRYIKFRD